MNMTKKINVNFSSLVGLKAELLRKQAEVSEAKLKSESITSTPQLSKKRTKKTVKNEESTELKDSEDIIAHKKSKLMLKAKTRLYERLKKAKLNNDKFLVDFKEKLDEPEEDFIDETIDKEYPIEPEENWVEYQDCFGRTRKCLKDDLPHMQKKDKLIEQEIMKKSDIEEENKEQYPVQEKEPEIEIMRRKWEEQTQKLADKVDIHYQDILFDEARTHGVGYYAFSQDEEERIKQQENLTNLRKETEKKQKEIREVKEVKDRIEQNRLKVARIRQRIRAGLPAELTEEELIQENKVINTTGNGVIDDKSTEESKDDSLIKTDCIDRNNKEIKTAHERENEENKIKAFAELLDKKDYWHVMSQEEWIEKCRAQRISKFGPVYDNFKSAGFCKSQDIGEQSTHKTVESNKEVNNTEICNKKSIDKCGNNLLSYEDTNIGDDTVFNVKNSKINDQNDESIVKHITIKNSEIEAFESTTSTSTISASSPATVSYPLSHLPKNYLQNMYDYFEKTHAPEQQMLQNNLNIPLPDEITTSSYNLTDASEQDGLSQNINEDRIMAGLKYLREKFEKSHTK
ncbi:coiled-coil domain-containing protein 174 [Pseudomyrmex gracilis]|uniref:coiled-coil domain-containing protein 174 n=1 Tax=Pseudomyrmex gracilis TaxID=219809 RepID=UPI000995257B|nr:coiled-coil domain-containing protein 174 [Pseudomyrmex gracilis]XP_020279557.1 coiled-coil domain-containing protein 174 [Pseudomyrmex gracilis]